VTLAHDEWMRGSCNAPGSGSGRPPPGYLILATFAVAYEQSVPLGGCQHDLQSALVIGGHDLAEPAQLHSEDFAVRERHDRLGLVPCCRCDVALHGQMGPEGSDYWSTQVQRMPLVVMQDEAARPAGRLPLSPNIATPSPLQALKKHLLFDCF